MATEQDKEQSPEPEPAEERRISFKERWLRLVEEGFERRVAQERDGTPVLPSVPGATFFQAGILALIDTLAQRRKRKARHKPEEGET